MESFFGGREHGMSYVERSDEEIIAAWERWAERHPQPDTPVLATGRTVYTPREMVTAMRQRDPKGFFERYLKIIRELARECGEDPVEMIDRSGTKP